MAYVNVVPQFRKLGCLNNLNYAHKDPDPAGFGSGQKRSSETLTGQYRLFGVSVVTCTAFEDGKSDVTGLSSF